MSTPSSLVSDFGEVIADAVRSSKVMLVVIGPKWLVAEDGNRRIDSADDYVRIELEQALGRGDSEPSGSSSTERPCLKVSTYLTH